MTNNEYQTITCTDDHKTAGTTDPRGKGKAIIYRKSWQPYIKQIYRIPSRAVEIRFHKDNNVIMILSLYLPTNPTYPEQRNETGIILKQLNKLTK